MLNPDHIQFFCQMAKERGPISSKRLKQLGSNQFAGTRFHKKYISACLNKSVEPRFTMENRGFEVGTGKHNLMLWVAN